MFLEGLHGFLLELCDAQGQVRLYATEKSRHIKILIRFLVIELCRAQGQKEKKKQELKYAGNSRRRTIPGRSISNAE